MSFENIEVGDSLYLEVKESVTRVIAHELVVTTSETFFLEVPVTKSNNKTFDVNADFDSQFDYYPQSTYGTLRFSRESGKCLDKEFKGVRLFNKGDKVKISKYIHTKDEWIEYLREVKCQYKEYQEWTRCRYYLDELLKEKGEYNEIPQDFSGIYDMFKYTTALLNDLTPNKVKDVENIIKDYNCGI